MDMPEQEIVYFARIVAYIAVYTGFHKINLIHNHSGSGRFVAPYWEPLISRLDLVKFGFFQLSLVWSRLVSSCLI